MSQPSGSPHERDGDAARLAREKAVGLEQRRQARQRRARAGVRDMVISLAVLLVPILLIVWFFTRIPDEPPVPDLEWPKAVAQARQQADFPLLAPRQVPAGWRATKARYVEAGGQWVGKERAAGDRWELGFLTADDVYVAINQSTEKTTPFVRTITGDAKAEGTVTVDGRQWRKMISSQGRTRYLVTEVDGSTAIVVADAPYSTLVEFAGLLAPA